MMSFLVRFGDSGAKPLFFGPRLKRAAVVVLTFFLLFGWGFLGGATAAYRECNYTGYIEPIKKTTTILWQTIPTFRSKRGLVGRRLLKLPRGLQVAICPGKRTTSQFGFHFVWRKVLVKYRNKIVSGWVFGKHVRFGRAGRPGPFLVAAIEPLPIPNITDTREAVESKEEI